MSEEFWMRLHPRLSFNQSERDEVRGRIGHISVVVMTESFQLVYELVNDSCAYHSNPSLF